MKLLYISSLIVFLFAILGQVYLAKNKRTSSESKYYPEREEFLLQKRVHKLKEYSQEARKRLADLNDYSHFYNSYLSEILRVRVPGTVGHHAVKQFIIGKLKDYGWKVSIQDFQSETPIGIKNFTNIVGTLYPEADRTLGLAAHYDSKLVPPKDGKYFLAATDSAVPCAMLLEFAKVLSDKASKNKNAPKDVSPQLIFLDGEEAFVEWTSTDSIYGSRKLAETMSVTPHRNKTLAKQGLKELDSMDAFVLFDLLGAKDPTFYNFFRQTSHLYNALQKIERQLHDANELTSTGPYFNGLPGYQMYIEDDHIPFLRKNVPILHIIPAPFPKVWHTLDDDESALDQATIENLLKIFRHFVLSYFHLE